MVYLKQNKEPRGLLFLYLEVLQSRLVNSWGIDCSGCFRGQAEKWGSPNLGQAVAKDPTAEGRAGGPSALRGCEENNQALGAGQKAHHLLQASAGKVKGARVAAGPRKGDVTGAGRTEGRPAWRPCVPHPLWAPLCREMG